MKEVEAARDYRRERADSAEARLAEHVDRPPESGADKPVTTPPVPDLPEVGSWRLSRTEMRVGMSVLSLSLVARWQALSSGYSIDDFALVVFDKPLAFGGFAAQGRALAYVLREALAALGASPAHAMPLSLALLMLTLVAVGLVVCRLWGVHGFAASLIVVSLVALHPYQSEVFTFKTAAMYVAIALACSFAGLLACTSSARHWMVSLVAVVCALCIYQAVLNHIAMALMCGVALHLSRPAGSNPMFWPGFRSRLKLILSAVMLYFLVQYAVTRMAGVPMSERASLIGPGDLGHRIDQTYKLYSSMFFLPEPIFPRVPKLLLLFTVAFGLGACLVRAVRVGAYAVPRRAALALAVILVACLPLCVGVVLVLGGTWWPVPRVLSQTGIFWAGSLALVYGLAQPFERRIIQISAVVMVVSFIGIANHVSRDQLRVNMRDLAAANRMVERIEALPDFAQIRYLVIDEGHYAYPSHITTAQGDMNISALSPAWSRVPVVNEVSGYAFQPAPRDLSAKARYFCQTAPRWPAPGSVGKVDAAAVVCRGN